MQPLSFRPAALTVAVLSTTSSSSTALSKTAPTSVTVSTSIVQIYNSGTSDIAVNFTVGAGTVVMPVVGTNGGYVVPKGTVAQIEVPAGIDHVNLIGAGTVYVTPGY